MSTETQHEAAFFRTIRSWNITRGDARVLGGVLSGVGARIGLAPVPARILFVVACLILGGPLVLLYAAAWGLLPDREGRIVIQDFGRGVPNVGALVAIAIIGFIGLGTLTDGGPFMPWSWMNDGGGFSFGVDGPAPFRIAGAVLFGLLALLFVAAMVAVVVWAIRQGRKAPTGPFQAPAPQRPAPAQYAVTRAEAAAGTAPTGAPVAPGVEIPTAPDTPTDGTPIPPVPPVPPAPPSYAPPARPRPPRVPGPGPAGYLAALALVPLSAAVAVYLHIEDQLSVSPLFAGGLVFTAGLGLILVLTALAGRRSGFLGFVAVMALIPTVLLIAFSDEVRDRYGDSAWPWNAPVEEVLTDETTAAPTLPAIDPSAVLGASYSTVVLAGSCYDQGDVFADTALPTIRLAAVTDDTSIDVASDSTRVVVPRGTSIVVESAWSDTVDVYSSTHVEWVSRDIACDLIGAGSTLARLTNPETPVLTLRVTDPDVGAFIQIEEN